MTHRILLYYRHDLSFISVSNVGRLVGRLVALLPVTAVRYSSCIFGCANFIVKDNRRTVFISIDRSGFKTYA